MRRILYLTFVLLAVIAPDCQTNQNHKQVDVIRVNGTVSFADLEGGFWLVKGDDGKAYDPAGGGLPAEFQKEGLRVRMEAIPRPDLASFHMVGTIVEIKKIERL